LLNWTLTSPQPGGADFQFAERRQQWVGKAVRLPLLTIDVRAGAIPAFIVVVGAFNRAFKREYGVPRATWRRTEAGDAGDRAGRPEAGGLLAV
jgi:hypothetical protein